MNSNKSDSTSWPLERVLFALAGTLVLAASILAAVVSPWFLLLTGFVAVNQLLYATLGFCGASLILQHLVGIQPACDIRGGSRS